MQETWVQSLGQEDLLEKKMAPTPVFLPGKSHRQKNLVGCSPWGHERARHDLVTKQQRQGSSFVLRWQDDLNGELGGKTVGL